MLILIYVYIFFGKSIGESTRFPWIGHYWIWGWNKVVFSQNVNFTHWCPPILPQMKFIGRFFLKLQIDRRILIWGPNESRSKTKKKINIINESSEVHQLFSSKEHTKKNYQIPVTSSFVPIWRDPNSRIK